MTTTAVVPPTPPITAPNDWPTLRTLTTDTAQRIFRACLTALSRPGTITRLPDDCVPTPVPAVVAPMLALTDLMTPVSGLDTTDVPGASRAADLIAWATGASVTVPKGARFAVAFAESEQMAELSVGSHWSPEFGATLCQRVTSLSDQATPTDQPALKLRLRGPGVETSTEVAVLGLSARFLELRAGLTADFPTGIDVLLVTDDGAVAGLPRTTRIEVL